MLGVIAASTKTLAGVLDRTRDVKDMVRKLAYQVIAERIHIRALTIAQRVRLLHEGLNDRIGKLVRNYQVTGKSEQFNRLQLCIL